MSHLEQNDVSGEKFSIVSSFEFSACKIMLQYTKYLLFIDSLIDWCLTRFSFQSSVCDKIMSQLGQDDVDRKQRRVVIINQDSFYKTLNEEEKKKALKGEFNFDHPGNLRERPI
jgi:hypothetical protein